MDQEGMCATLFTLSAEVNNWSDLNQISYGDREMQVLANES